MHLVNVIRTSDGGLWIVPELAAIRERGINVSVVLPDSTGRLARALREAEFPINVLAEPLLTARGIPNPRAVSTLRNTLVELKADAILYQLIQTAVVTRLAGGKLGIPLIHRVPGPLYLENPFLRQAERFLARRDWLNICGSDFTRDAYLRLGMDPASLRSIPFGVDVDRFQPPSVSERRLARGQLGVADDELCFVMVAFAYAPKQMVFRGRGIKGHEVLQRAWAAYSHQTPKAKLVVVGDPWGEAAESYRASLEREFLRSSRPGSVTWLTGVGDVREVYRAGDVSVSPSLSENHGAALEAGAMGLVNIVSDAGGLPETVSPDSGIVTKAGDDRELLEALRTVERIWRAGKLQTMAAAGRDWVAADFAQADCARRVGDCVGEFLDAPARRLG